MNNEPLKISIITATKNNKAGLLRAIESVRSQTYKNVEHIIVDGLSTDGTQEILKQVQNDIIRQAQGEISQFSNHYSLRIISEPDEGIYDAINKGIKMATGDVIGLLHSDDFYADEFVLERYAKVFQDKSLKGNDESISSSRTNVRDLKISLPTSRVRNDNAIPTDNQSPATNNPQTKIDAVYSDLVYVRRKRGVGDRKMEVDTEKNQNQGINPLYHIPYTIIRTWKTQERDFTTVTQRHREILNGWMPPHPTLFLRKEVFDKYGLYRTDMKIAADYEMILRLFYKYKITSCYLPFTTYCMTIGGASNKSLKNIFIKSREDHRALKLHNLPLAFITLLFKNLRKLPQFIQHQSKILSSVRL